MTIFALKIIACLSMLIDHVRYIIPQNNLMLFCIGRLSFPIFAFLITEGYVHTSNLKKYYIRLLIFAVISQIPFMIFRKNLIGEWKLLNVLFTFLLGLSTIIMYDRVNNKFISYLGIVSIFILAYFIKLDYGLYGVLAIFIMFAFKKSKNLTILLLFLDNILNLYLLQLLVWDKTVILFVLFTMIAYIIAMYCYNGKVGRKIKYFFYWFYPVHMVVIYVVSKMILIV